MFRKKAHDWAPVRKMNSRPATLHPSPAYLSRWTSRPTLRIVVGDGCVAASWFRFSPFLALRDVTLYSVFYPILPFPAQDQLNEFVDLQTLYPSFLPLPLCW